MKRIYSNLAVSPSRPSRFLQPHPFALCGITDYHGRNDSGNAMAVQADGKFIVAGGLDLDSGSPWKIGLVGYLP